MWCRWIDSSLILSYGSGIRCLSSNGRYLTLKSSGSHELLISAEELSCLSIEVELQSWLCCYVNFSLCHTILPVLKCGEDISISLPFLYAFWF